MKYKKSKILQQKSANYNGVGKKALKLKDNRSAKYIVPERTTQLRGLDEEEDELQLKVDTPQKKGLNEEEEYPLQMKENNTGLPDNLKSGIETMSGFSMDDVNVHYNSGKPAQLNAHAYAQGTDIHLASGQEKHLAHEAWHVVQQKQGRVQPTTSFGGAQINDNEGLENEADVMGSRALQMKTKNKTEVTQLGKNKKYKKSTDDYLDDYYDELADEMTEEDVYNEWNPKKAWESAIANPTPRAAWDYNVTFQWDVIGWKLRAHVHYYDNGDGTYRKVPGSGWVSGIDDFDFRTPQSVVNRAPNDPTTV